MATSCHCCLEQVLRSPVTDSYVEKSWGGGNDLLANARYAASLEQRRLLVNVSRLFWRTTICMFFVFCQSEAGESFHCVNAIISCWPEKRCEYGDRLFLVSFRSERLKWCCVCGADFPGSESYGLLLTLCLCFFCFECRCACSSSCACCNMMF